MTTVTAVEHIDVRGKKQYYLKVQRGQREYIINVGNKTFSTVKEMENEPATVENNPTVREPRNGRANK